MVSTNNVIEEGQQLPDYELVLVISPEVADEDIEITVDKVRRFITEKGGTISDTEEWGRRRLAYPIKHFTDGRYFLVKFNMGPAFGRELEANLKISEEVLRHLLIKLES
ncbi:MAG: 30S ribosomal protein S6 [Dehalococcoidales bacterium]|nr:MAG: 30S ribosomal protein S6 [Dehalococcoidales bacterium]